VGWCHILLGNHATAVPLCEEALGALRALNDRQGMADTLDSLGRAHLGLRDFAQSVNRYQQAVVLYHEIENLPAEAESLGYLGEALNGMRDEAAAADAWRRALRILADIRQPDTHDLETRLRQLSAPGQHSRNDKHVGWSWIRRAARRLMR
jgi:tetratricopeptide (TPR) repeat protein